LASRLKIFRERLKPAHLDFYSDSIIDDWTCLNIVEFYRAKLKQKDLKQALDQIKKDLEEVANSEFVFDVTRIKKAQEILDNWKVWFLVI
jgi:hypothetical protein